MRGFGRSVGRPTPSEKFRETLPVGPLVAHLTNLHALMIHLGAQGDALSVGEHHLREIATYTHEDPRLGPRRYPRPVPDYPRPIPDYPRPIPDYTAPVDQHLDVEFPGVIADYVKKARQAENDLVEEVAEQMLTQEGTDYGILIVEVEDPPMLLSGNRPASRNSTITVSLSPEVPFGQIHRRKETR